MHFQDVSVATATVGKEQKEERDWENRDVVSDAGVLVKNKKIFLSLESAWISKRFCQRGWKRKKGKIGTGLGLDDVYGDGWRMTQEVEMEGMKVHDQELEDEVGGRQYGFIFEERKVKKNLHLQQKPFSLSRVK